VCTTRRAGLAAHLPFRYDRRLNADDVLLAIEGLTIDSNADTVANNVRDGMR
jgi:hypothetical protein